MSNVRKIYNLGNKIKEITERKSFKVSLMSFLTIFLLFGVLNSYAVEDVPQTITPDWEGEKKFHNIVNKADETEDNSQTSLGQQNVTTLWTGVLYLGGEDLLDEETKAKLEAANVPYDLRRGVIGMIDDASMAVYASYPLVNVPDHLAQQWVPGYKDSTTALYAEDGTWSGYSELKAAGIQPLWTNVLNLAYLFFVIVMIIAGFMIMFRHKIGGQAMVTLGNVLPNVIIALVVATFSFAIAGLIIDFGGLIIGLIVSVFDLSDTATSIAGFGKLFSNVFTGGVKMATLISGIGGALGLGGILGGAKLGLFTAVTNPVAWAVGAAVGAIGLLFTLIVLGIIAFGAIKVLITLFKAYFQLLLSVILGPLQITLGAIPGNNAAIMNWMKGVLRNVLVFPVVFFIVNLPNALIKNGAEMRLRLPAKLVYETEGYDASGPNVTGGLVLFVLKIFVLFFAAQAPKFIESFLPPSSNKGLAAGFDSVRGSLQKVPLIGGTFGK
ncbi:MAG TPA: hypothetical protein PLT51_02440 [Candidatus Dojkabacteria bacterium]|nr:hypothetical protein [Candidatus Dojkabacteria bacterium]